MSEFSEICQKRIKQGLALATGNPQFVVRLIIDGEPASKANSRKVVKFGKRTAVIKSKKARGFVASAREQLAKQFSSEPWTGRIGIAMTIFYESLRPDLDESLVLDAMQGIVFENDRQVVSKNVLRGHSDKGYVVVDVLAYLD